MAKKYQTKASSTKKLVGDERIIDLLERLGVLLLYTSTPLGQNEVAKAIGIDVHRVNSMVKGININNKK